MHCSLTYFVKRYVTFNVLENLRLTYQENMFCEEVDNAIHEL